MSQAHPALADVPPEVLAHIVHFLELPRDLAALNGASRLFRGGPAGGSLVERVLRERAAARAGSVELGASAKLPKGVLTWTEELFTRERLREVAAAHSSPAVAGGIGNLAFSAFVDADGRLHTCGESEREENGVRRARGHPACSLPGSLEQPVHVPTRVASLSAVRVRAIAAGCKHLLALGAEGAVYACGENQKGQLGQGDMLPRATFQLVRALYAEPSGRSAICVSAGDFHSVALGSGGDLFSWGFNHYGQLGHGDEEDRLEPRVVLATRGARIGGVSAGGSHTLLLCARGTVYSCGWGGYYQLGHGDRGDRREPTRIEALAGTRVAHVSAGYNHSLVVDAAGGVHSFGCGGVGRLGHGDQRDRPVPKRIAALAGRRAVRASAGYFNSAVVCADGSAHAFGGNAYGQLGLADGRGTLEPRPIQLVGRVCDCSLSERHSLVVTADGAVHACGRHSGALGLGEGAASAEADESAALPGLRTPLHAPRRIERLAPLTLAVGLMSISSSCCCHRD